MGRRTGPPRHFDRGILLINTQTLSPGIGKALAFDRGSLQRPHRQKPQRRMPARRKSQLQPFEIVAGSACTAASAAAIDSRESLSWSAKSTSSVASSSACPSLTIARSKSDDSAASLPAPAASHHRAKP